MRKADWLIGFLIAAVFLIGMTYLVKSYNDIKNQDPNRPSVEETLANTSAGETATLDEEDEYDEEEYPDDMDTTTYIPEEPTIDDLADLNAAREREAEGNTNGGTVPKSYNSDDNKSYLVVAGTFKQMANAQIQLNKFKKMGYADAEIGKFNKSAYASLIVDRFATSAEAKRYVSTLKNKGVEAYVHKKR